MRALLVQEYGSPLKQYYCMNHIRAGPQQLIENLIVAHAAVFCNAPRRADVQLQAWAGPSTTRAWLPLLLQRYQPVITRARPQAG